MASDSIMTTTTVSVTLIYIVSFSIFTAVTSIPQDEMNAALRLLRSRDHALFANAIATSDLLFEFLAVEALTILAPPDPSIFALDMTQSPPFYLSTLLTHAITRRLSHSDLSSLRNGTSVSTLLPSRDLVVTKVSDSSDVILFDGVRAATPGLFYGGHVAVHGIAGLLLTFNHEGVIPPSPPPDPVTETIGPSVADPTEQTNGTYTFLPDPNILVNGTIDDPSDSSSHDCSPPAPLTEIIDPPAVDPNENHNETFTFPPVPMIPADVTVDNSTASPPPPACSPPAPPPPACSPPAPPAETAVPPVAEPNDRSNRTFTFLPVPRVPVNRTIDYPIDSPPPPPPPPPPSQPNGTVMLPVPFKRHRTHRTFYFPPVPRIPLNRSVSPRHLPKIATPPPPMDRVNLTTFTPLQDDNCTVNSPPSVPLNSVLASAPLQASPTGSPDISPASSRGSPESSPVLSPSVRNLIPPKISGVSFARFGFQLARKRSSMFYPKRQAREDMATELLTE